MIPYFETQLGKLYHGDCFDVMPQIADKSIDMILCDLPYGTTACSWDIIIPFESLWKQYKRIIKDNGAICLFGNEPFTSKLIISNSNGFKYKWTWDKKIPSGMSYAKYRPMSQVEDICIFTKSGNSSVYYPQMIPRTKLIKSGGTNYSESAPLCYKDKNFRKVYTHKNPTTLIKFEKVRFGSVHPTQKPVSLFIYLIRTYTKENELILDNCIGSGTTAVACEKLNRKWIGIEKEEKYCKVAKERLEKETEQLKLF